MQLTQLGPYKIDKPLGKGGMGSVYAATDTHTGQRVAIKALSPHLAMAEGFRERFEAEIESLKTLRHDGIVRLFGYGEQDGILFYSMEVVDGISLEDELKAGRRFSWREVTSIAIQLALALKHAHDHGIVHRDIKPANILLSGDEHVKLADFGIARLFGNTQLTTAGGVLGTADYMSPEQAEGRPVTARCDQYSLGGVMYALLAGRPPFQAKNLPQMLQLQRFAQPDPVRRYAPDTPEQLEGVIMQLLAKDPADRFPNTQVLARHLQAMVIALSRPAADDFALAGEHSANPQTGENVARRKASEATQVDDGSLSISLPPIGGERESLANLATQDAATLAAEDVSPSILAAARAKALAPAADDAPRSRFTTVEEEEARLRSQNQRSWLTIAAQLGALVAVLAAMGALAMRLSRDHTADELYARVADRGDAPLSGVERDIDQFLIQFPADDRAEEMQRLKSHLELERLERRLRRRARDSGSADPSLLPVEQLYLQAANVEPSDPAEAARLYQSLTDLYGPELGGETSGDVAAIVQLARQRLKTVRNDVKKRETRLVGSLNERMKAAAELEASQPEQAAAMYHAIVSLYERDAWAQEIVAQARAKLLALEARK